MKYLDADRDPRLTRDLVEEIRRAATQRWTLLEVCAGQTQNIVRLVSGGVLPEALEWLHGPGCSESVLPSSCLARLIALAHEPGLIVCVPGDLLRVPAGRESLEAATARGADVRVVYSPLDALALARKLPGREIVALASGFETMAPAAAASVIEAERLGLENFFMESRLLVMGAAVRASIESLASRTDGMLISGPVCAVTGIREYEEMSRRFQVPMSVIGPEPIDLLEGLLRIVRQLEHGVWGVDNQYARAVRPDGNPQALASIDAVFEPADADWRGLGRLPRSGLTLRERYRRFDASARFAFTSAFVNDCAECQDREILSARMKPPACRSFGTLCRPDHPLGAPMAASEGLCRTYYRFQKTWATQTASPALPVIPTQVAPGT
jgi:hydrogenase expression/formation protein HypD